MRGRLGLLLTFALASGCSSGPDPVSPNELQVIPAQTFEEEPLPPRYELVLWAQPTGELPGDLADVDLWLPVPPSDSDQQVLTLIWEVDEPATVEGKVIDPGGDRVLHVRSPQGFPSVRLRALVEVSDEDPSDLAAPLADLDRDLTPDAWVAAATERGATARVANVFELDEEVLLARTPEVQLDGEWVPVSLATAQTRPGAVRLGTAQPRAEAQGNAIDVRLAFELSEAPPER